MKNQFLLSRALAEKQIPITRFVLMPRLGTLKARFLFMCALAALSLCKAAYPAEASFQGLGGLPGSGGFGSIAMGVSADGTIAVGYGNSNNGTEAFRWTAATGMVGLGDLLGGIFRSQALGISADGSVIVGESIGLTGRLEAFRWTAATGMVGLGTLRGGASQSSAKAVSADGSVIVGSSFNGENTFEAFRWTVATGMVTLGDLPGGNDVSVAMGVSADGSTVVGYSSSASSDPSRVEAFRWTSAGGMLGLGVFPGGIFNSIATAVSADGSTVVGWGASEASLETGFRWTATTAMQSLDTPSFNTRQATAVSQDGAVVVGWGSADIGREAFIWDAAHGTRVLKHLLEDLGVNMSGWSLNHNGAHAMSANGQHIVGAGTKGGSPSFNGFVEAWIAHLPNPDTTAPVLSLPHSTVLEATGPNGATVTFSASALDAVSGLGPVTLTPPSGSSFPLGTTTVNASATDVAGNTATGSFTVTVRDSTPPALSLPSSGVVEATSPNGAVATFGAFASDLVSGSVPVTLTPASGSTFALGITTVDAIATDDAGNAATGSFTVSVRDSTAPTIIAPANLIAEATSAAGAGVTFSASATDIVNGAVSVTATPASGSMFALGTTIGTFTTRDASGNTASQPFTVTVVDTTAPVITSLHPNAPTLWPPNHAMVSVTVSSTATDVVGVASQRIVSVTSDEPDNGLGDGDIANDMEITGALTLNLRAERSGTGHGRTYTITVEAHDAAGNASQRAIAVAVPKSQSGK